METRHHTPRHSLRCFARLLIALDPIIHSSFHHSYLYHFTSYSQSPIYNDRQSTLRFVRHRLPHSSPPPSLPRIHQLIPRSGEPGTSGREPFDEGSLTGGNTNTGLGSGSSGLASHGGTIARDTEVRDGQVVGLAGPTDVRHPSSSYVSIPLGGEC